MHTTDSFSLGELGQYDCRLYPHCVPRSSATLIWIYRSKQCLCSTRKDFVFPKNKKRAFFQSANVTIKITLIALHKLLSIFKSVCKVCACLCSAVDWHRAVMPISFGVWVNYRSSWAEAISHHIKIVPNSTQSIEISTEGNQDSSARQLSSRSFRALPGNARKPIWWAGWRRSGWTARKHHVSGA